MKLTVIIPTYNEERTIEQLLRRVVATHFPIDYEVVLVDDHSRDQTYSIERRLQESLAPLPIRLVRNRTQRGKSACIRHGLKFATGDWVLIQDGDLEYKPREIPKLLKPVLEKKAEVVYGSRFLSHRWPPGMAWPNFLANRFLTWLTNFLYRLHLTDMETCYKLIPRDLLRSLRIGANQFEFEPEVTAKLAKGGVKILEVPISYHGRSPRQGKKIRIKDFWIAAWALFRYRF